MLADALVSLAGPVRLPHYLTHFVAGKTPLSLFPAVVTALSGYLAVIFGIQELMKNRKPMKLTLLFQAHNIILSLGSGLLLLLMIEEIVPILWRAGLFGAICNVESWTPVRRIVTCDALT